MQAPERIKILVTGFGPFPGVRSNPSADLLLWIKERHIRLNHNIQLETATLPTSWRAVETFTSGMLTSFDPDIALHFGVHFRATTLRLEKLARNCTCTQADVFGERATRSCVIDLAPRALKSTFDTEKLATELRARGVPAQCSMNAGRYLCNALLFASLNQCVKRNSPRQTGFIHIPPLYSRGIDRNVLLKAAEITISHCVARHIHMTPLNAVNSG